MLRVLLADRQPAVTDVLALRLEAEPDVHVAAVATSARTLHEHLASAEVDVLVTDIDFDDSDADELLESTRRLSGDLRLVVLTSRHDPDTAVEVLRAGAAAYLTREATVDDLLAAIRGSVGGGTFVTPTLLTTVIGRLLGTAATLTVWEKQVLTLTARERETLECMVAGMGSAAIARELLVSPNTVRTHTQRVREKLGVHSTIEAVSVARRAGVKPRRRT